MWRQVSSLSRRWAVAGVASTVTAGAAYTYHLRQQQRQQGQDLPALTERDATVAGAGLTARLFNALSTRSPVSVAYAETEQDVSPVVDDWQPPSRDTMLERLQQSATPDQAPFDLLIVGGGATGTGVLLDATLRGLNVALVEKDDFSSGTSSRSTKLVHGGVRYLEKAFMELDFEQYKLVREALHERAVFLRIAPYLSDELPIMLPLYKWWQMPYYWAGCKVYDLLAGKDNMESSYLLSRTRAIEAFPMLKKDHLVGALIYHDGQHNDSRMNVMLAMTAVAHGATAANHVEVLRLIKERNPEGEEVICGAEVRDTLTGKTWPVRAKGVINATGPFIDGLRKMDEPKAENIVVPSAGVHVILPSYYAPARMGLIDPSTSDGRVIFFLPWQGSTIVGTTDSPTSITDNPMPKEAEIQWILDEVQRYLSPDVQVRRGDVLAAWSGIRPLVRDPKAHNTAELVRNHMIDVSSDRLLTIAGGKWTTYRAMAMETVDEAVRVFGLHPAHTCQTENVRLLGSHHYSPTMFIRLIQQFGLEMDVAKYLAANYGDRAFALCEKARPTGRRWPKRGHRVASGYPYIEAEVRYAVHNEYACTAVDVLGRRTRLAFLNAQAASEALPRIVDIMAEELGWNKQRKQQEIEQGLQFLRYMGHSGTPAA